MNKQSLIRKTHRYLGIFIGIQFLGWTVSGLFFSWNEIDDVHGDHMRKSPTFVKTNASLATPQAPITELRGRTRIDSIHSVLLISLVGKPLYQIAYFSRHAGEVHHHVSYALADATTGVLRDPLTKNEAIQLARDYVVKSAGIAKVTLLEDTDSHHEYRGRPLPAYAVSFKNPDCTIYISTERGTFQTIRHDQWRAFDFLWMFHTMDYKGRDNFNNWLLKSFSILGLMTVLSGFVLFFISSPTLKKMNRKITQSPALFLIAIAIAFASCEPKQTKEHQHESNPAIESVPADTVKKSIPQEEHAEIGAAQLIIKYHAPAVRGRVIWGGLVPYGEVWVTGAHSATSLEISKDILVDNRTVPAGKYALFTIPGNDKWTIILNKNWKQHLADEYNQTKPHLCLHAGRQSFADNLAPLPNTMLSVFV